MKKLLSAVLTLILLAGCSNKGLQAPWTPTPLTTPFATNTFASLAPGTPGSQTNPTAMPSITVSGLEGFGRKVGTLAASYGDTLYYYKNGTDIYQKTTSTQRVRQLNDDNSIYQLFTDDAGNLYYCTMGYDNSSNAEDKYFNRLYRYDKNKDELIAENLSSVVRVDREYIFYLKFFAGDTDTGGDKLCAYRLKDKKTFQVANPDDVLCWDDRIPSVDFKQENGSIQFTITNALLKQNKKVSLSANALGIQSQDDYPGQCVAFWDENVLLVSVYGDNEQTTVYRIDMAQSKLLSSRKFNGMVDFSSSYKGKAYFCVESETAPNRVVYSLDLAAGSIVQLVKVSNFYDEDDAMYMQVEIESGLLFIYGREEGDGVYNAYYSAIPI